MNNRGQFFAIYLCIITVVMASAMIMFNVYFNNKISNSMAPPTELLVLQDKISLFELQENNFLCLAVKGNAWGESSNVLASFVNLIEKDDSASAFLFSSLKYNGQILELNDFSSAEARKLVYDSVYSVTFSGDNLNFQRKELVKHLTLMPPDTSKINFPLDIEYAFSRTQSFKSKEMNC